MENLRSEDVYGEKLDRCLYNGILKSAGGIAGGVVTSFFLFKRKPWPVILGAGVGVGFAVASCQSELKNQLQLNKIPMHTSLENVEVTSNIADSKPEDVKEFDLKAPKVVKPEDSSLINLFGDKPKEKDPKTHNDQCAPQKPAAAYCPQDPCCPSNPSCPNPCYPVDPCNPCGPVRMEEKPYVPFLEAPGRPSPRHKIVLSPRQAPATQPPCRTNPCYPEH